jgi:RNA-directed DNA polymerase
MTPDFRRMRNVGDLPTYLGEPEHVIDRLRRAGSAEVFRRHQIPKKGRGGGTREVWELKRLEDRPLYRSLRLKLHEFFCEALTGFPHDGAHGYVSRRSTVSNAKVHVGASQVLCVDIAHFFRSITAKHVRQLLGRCGVNSFPAGAICEIVVWDDHIPLGLATSPVIANAVCHELDERLAQLVPGGRYSRYADDLFFSGPQLPTRSALELELDEFGFCIADGKFRLARAGRGLYVTGLSIEDGVRPHVPRDLKRRLQQDLHYAHKYDLRSHIGRRGYPSIQSGVNKIQGLIQYVRGVEREFGNRLQKKWNEIVMRDGLEATYPPRNSDPSREVVCIVDESIVQGPSGDVLLLCLTVVEDIEWVRKKLLDLLEERKADAYSSEDEKTTLDKSGLHWAELTHDDRTRAVEVLQTLPFRAFVAFKCLPSQRKPDVSAGYELLLERLLRPRFKRYDGCAMKVFVEQNPKIGADRPQEIVSTIFQSLQAANSRRPASMPICTVFAKNADSAGPIADLVLGVVTEYARSEINAGKDLTAKRRKPGTQAATRYDRIKHKIRAIYDHDSGAVYSPRNLFKPWVP